MSTDYEKWNRLTRILMWITGSATLAVVLLIFTPLFLRAEAMRRQVHQLDRQIQHIRHTNAQLEAEIAALQRDPRAVEKAARELLGVAKPHETIYRFQNGADGKASPR